jgi:virginiamycin A acetyltransferase
MMSWLTKSANNHTNEGRSSSLCSTLAPKLYALTKNPTVRRLLRRWVMKMEGNEVYSLTIREIFRRFHGVDVGLYTIGPCESAPGNLAPGTTVGRYSSIYSTVRTVTQDAPSSARVPDGLFSDAALGEVTNGNGAPFRLAIGHDVFIGHNVIILPSVEQIGDGAVIGAGSVVRTSIPPFAVITGNPARVVRYRFSENRIKELSESKWWLKSIDELSVNMEEFRKPLEGDAPVR